MSISNLVVRLCAVVLMCIVYVSNVNAQLPPEIQVDRLWVQAERESAEGNHWSAAYTLEQALKMYEEHGLAIPAEFWIRFGEALQSAGLHEAAVEASTRYLQEAGREGEHYQTALRLLDVAENDLAAARREEARRIAEAERLAAERAAAEAERAALAAAALPVAMPEMVVIPAGTFRMGCVSGNDCQDDEFPVHDVTIPEPFEVSVYEVTFAQWDACVSGGGCGGYRPDDEGWGRGNRPVVNVSWEDAQAFVSWLSRYTGEDYRLLSEAEWEYVARAGTETAYGWGDAIGRNRANCLSQSILYTRRERCVDRWEYTAPVGSFAANAFGVHDMHGNVWEWVEDCWNDGYAGPPPNSRAWLTGDCSRRVFRGGSWVSVRGDLRSASRGTNIIERRGGSLGFRVARTLR